MFNSCRSLKTLDLTNFNVDAVYSAYKMFYGCDKLKDLKVNTKFIIILLNNK